MVITRCWELGELEKCCLTVQTCNQRSNPQNSDYSLQHRIKNFKVAKRLDLNISHYKSKCNRGVS